MGSAARSSMPSMPLEWSLLVLAVLQIAGAQICGDVKTEYKTQGCCNDKTQKFDLKPLQDEFAFSLTELSQTNTGPDGGWDWPSAVFPLLAGETDARPIIDPACFYPVTLPALADSGHLTYSWIPHDSPAMASFPSFLTEAPNGAFVYKMYDDTLQEDQQHLSTRFLYKKITSVAIDDPDATIIFRRASDWTHQTTFQEVMDQLITPDIATDYSTNELKRALSCFGGSSVSLGGQPFDDYHRFVWTAGPFSLAGKSSACGAFVYEKIDGGIVYHAC